MDCVLRSAFSVLLLSVACACSSSVRYDSSARYTPEETANIATLSNSPTVVLYSVDGERIPENFEANSMGRWGDKSYEKLVGKENSINSGFHCFLFQSIYNNEIFQIPAHLENGKDYQIINYSTPAGLNLFDVYVTLFITPAPSAMNSRGFISLYDKEKVGNVTFEPTGDGTGDYDRRFNSRDEEAAFRNIFEGSEITGILQTGQYHQVFFQNFAETNFQLAKKNVSDEQLKTCPPVRLMMANGVKQSYLDYLKHPPSLSGAAS